MHVRERPVEVLPAPCGSNDIHGLSLLPQPYDGGQTGSQLRSDKLYLCRVLAFDRVEDERLPGRGFQLERGGRCHVDASRDFRFFARSSAERADADKDLDALVIRGGPASFVGATPASVLSTMLLPSQGPTLACLGNTICTKVCRRHDPWFLRAGKAGAGASAVHTAALCPTTGVVAVGLPPCLPPYSLTQSLSSSAVKARMHGCWSWYVRVPGGAYAPEPVRRQDLLPRQSALTGHTPKDTAPSPCRGIVKLIER